MVEEALAHHLRAVGVDLAILFGSRGEGRARPDSDWDIGVLAPAELDLDRLCADLEGIVHGRVDLVNLRRASPLLCMEAVRHGRILVQRDRDVYPSFVSLSLRRYNDTQKLRDAEAEYIRLFLTARGLA